MRIRKRKVPFPLSSLSPVPVSDLQLLRQSPVVQLQLHNSNPHHNLCDPLPFYDPTSSSDFPSHPIAADKLFASDSTVHCPKHENPDEEDHTRSPSLLGGAKTDSEVVHQQSSSSQQVRWFEGEQAFPLKKRRGNFERRSSSSNSNNSNNTETTMLELDTKKMKTKMNKKCMQSENNKEGIVDDGVKKRGRGGALMEGSRCSRVNGRGWRCCQQTLVGYSLCEHHLGKGRLRSMTSVRSRSTGTSGAKKKASMSAKRLSSDDIQVQKRNNMNVDDNDDDDDVEDDDEGGDEKKPLMTSSKRKTKLGLVKARSISSLLGQANGAIVIEDNSQ